MSYKLKIVNELEVREQALRRFEQRQKKEKVLELSILFLLSGVLILVCWLTAV